MVQTVEEKNKAIVREAFETTTAENSPL